MAITLEGLREEFDRLRTLLGQDLREQMDELRGRCVSKSHTLPRAPSRAGAATALSQMSLPPGCVRSSESALRQCAQGPASLASVAAPAASPETLTGWPSERSLARSDDGTPTAAADQASGTHPWMERGWRGYLAAETQVKMEQKGKRSVRHCSVNGDFGRTSISSLASNASLRSSGVSNPRYEVEKSEPARDQEATPVAWMQEGRGEQESDYGDMSSPIHRRTVLQTGREAFHLLFSKPYRKSVAETSFPPNGAWVEQLHYESETPTSFEFAKAFVTSTTFDVMVSAVLLLNAAWIGVEVEWQAAHREDDAVFPVAFIVVNWIFCALFVLELGLRIIVHGPVVFWFMVGWQWNVFDAVVIGLQLLDEIVSTLVRGGMESSTMPSNVGFIRTVRILRLVRTVRLVRLLRLIRELHTMVCSILAAFRSFLWTVVLFAVIVYVASLYFTQLNIDFARPESDLNLYFGSIGRSILSLYQAVFGGIDWDEMVRPMMKEISPWTSVVFGSYVAFSMLVVMNIVTGVFVDAAQVSTRNDKSVELVNMLSELFKNSNTISWTEFAAELDNPLLKQYFKSLDLDPSEARGLFNLLDFEGTGEVEAEEFVCGCLRLRGPAKSIDLALLMKEHSRAQKLFTANTVCMLKALAVIEEKFALPHSSFSNPRLSTL